jgi:hypothetical protein
LKLSDLPSISLPTVQQKHEMPIVRNSEADWWDITLFIFNWALYFLIEVNEKAPNFNMVEGCYTAWYGQAT